MRVYIIKVQSLVYIVPGISNTHIIFEWKEGKVKYYQSIPLLSGTGDNACLLLRNTDTWPFSLTNYGPYTYEMWHYIRSDLLLN